MLKPGMAVNRQALSRLMMSMSDKDMTEMQAKLSQAGAEIKASLEKSRATQICECGDASPRCHARQGLRQRRSARRQEIIQNVLIHLDLSIF